MNGRVLSNVDGAYRVVVLLAFLIPIAGVFDAAADSTTNNGFGNPGSVTFLRVERTIGRNSLETTGAGVFISASGHILTTSQVVANRVTLPFEDGDRSFDAPVDRIVTVINSGTGAESEFTSKLIAIDMESQLALLKIEFRPQSFETFEFFDFLEPGRPFRSAQFPCPSVRAVTDPTLPNRSTYPRVIFSDHDYFSWKEPVDELCPTEFEYRRDKDLDSQNAVFFTWEGRLVGLGPAAWSEETDLGTGVTTCRIRAFLARVGMHIHLDPGIILDPPQPIEVRVNSAVVPIEAFSGQAVFNGENGETIPVDLTPTTDTLSGRIDVTPEILLQSQKLRYSITIRLASELLPRCVEISHTIDRVPPSFRKPSSPPVPTPRPIADFEETEIDFGGPGAQSTAPTKSLSEIADSIAIQTATIDNSRVAGTKQGHQDPSQPGRYQLIHDPELKALARRYDNLKRDFLDIQAEEIRTFQQIEDPKVTREILNRLSAISSIMADRGIRWCPKLEIFYEIDTDPTDDPCEGQILVF